MEGTDSRYAVRDGDTLQSIAAAHWGDASLWYLIAEANGLSGSEYLAPGANLIIPDKVTNIHNRASTFEVYDPNRALGDLSPSTYKPPRKAGLAGHGRHRQLPWTLHERVNQPTAVLARVSRPCQLSTRNLPARTEAGGMKDDESPLFREVRIGALDPAQPGLDLSVIGAGGVSLLHVAIAMRQPEIALRLIEHGVPLDVQERNGQSALHFAATYDAREVAHAIIAARANPNLIDRYGNGPLWPAAIGAKGDYRLVEALIAAGASPEHRNQAGWSVMEMARSRGDGGLWLACGGSADDF